LKAQHLASEYIDGTQSIKRVEREVLVFFVSLLEGKIGDVFGLIKHPFLKIASHEL
jgi:rRNA processing protein Gar1